MPNEFVARNGVIALNNSQVTGSLSVTAGITGSLFGTASQALTASFITNAVSSSFAATASSADNFTVRGTLTAQTIVAQVITSSTDFVTGSTRFGSLLSNTHAFTGSVGMTGSLTVDGNTVVTGSLTTRITRTSSTNATALTLSDNVTGAQTDGVYKSIRSTSNNGSSVSEIRFLETDGTNNNTSIAFATAPTAGGITERMRINQNGNVGIGTTSPTSLLHIQGSDPFIRINNSSGNDHGIKISYNNSDTFGLHLIYNPNAATASIDNTYPTSAGQVYGDIHIRQNVGGAMTTRMVIKADGGNVGIGTTSPSTRLHIGTKVIDDNTYTYDTGSLMVVHQTPTSTTTLNDPQEVLLLARQGTSGQAYGAAASFRLSRYENSLVNSRTRLDIVLANNSFINAGQNTTVMTLQSAGNVGIGTTSPNARLDVSGSAIVSGSFTVSPSNAIELQVVSTGVKLGNVITDVHTVTGSLNISGSTIVTGSLLVSQGVTSSLFGTASWANNAISSSFATTASFVQNAVTASYVLNAVSASFAATASNVLGGAANYVPLFNTATTLSSSVMYQSSGNVGIGTTSPSQKLEVSGNIKLTSGGYLYGDGSNAYLQLTNANGSRLAYGSSVYLEALAASINVRATSEQIDIFNNSGRIYLSGAGNVGISTTTPNAKLDVNGNAIVTGSLTVTSGITGSLFGTASWASQALTASFVTNAVSSSFSATASSADNFTVRGTLTAQTIVAQVITSSTDFITGSTRFGTLLTNTHTFTGSVNMTGSLTVAGNITPTPNNTYTLGGGSNKFSQIWGSRFFADDGTVSLPTYTFSGDQDSGFWKPSDGVLATSTNGVERMRIDSSGNVGIGTTSPSARLHISGSSNTQLKVEGSEADVWLTSNGGGAGTWRLLGSSGNSTKLFRIYDHDNSTDRFNITSGGNVGIGTTTPSARTHIVGPTLTTTNENTYPLWVSDTGDTTKALILGFDLANDIGVIQAVDQSVTWKNIAIAPTSGNVGIGTTTPQAKLEIYPGTITDANRQEVLRIDVPGNNIFSTAEGYINFRGYDVSNNVNQDVAHIGTQLASDLSANNRYGGNLLFYTRPTGASQTPTERMRITAAGNVGIGTTSPNAKLDVNGNAIVTGSLTVTSGITGSLFGTASWASQALTASFVTNAVSSSFAATASSADNFTVRGTLTAQTIVAQVITSSTDFVTGSTRFGTLLTNTHQFTGSVSITGSLNVTGAGITGSLFGTASWANNAVTASHAITASFLLGSVISASFASTASSVNRLTQNVSISGSLTVSGSSVAASLQGSGSAVFSVDGTLGRLFQVDDTLSGSLFSVNTAGGVPLIEAFSDNTVRMGQFGSRVFFVSQSRVGVGKELALGATLDVSGSALVTGSLSVSQGVTASLFGTASVAVTASFAVTAAFALNSGGGGSAFPFNGDAMITGSLNITSPTIGSTRYIYGYTSSLSGSLSVVSTAATSSFRAAFYNYVAASGSNARAGQIAAVWYLSTCSFSETVTTDIGTTSNLDVTARLSGGSIQLVALANTSNWIVETSVNLV